ncbi:MAG: glycoside hydrolase family 9 protein, partial [Acidobacteriaceae bacterium]|nr:glycoside hydrolase family 9 protein [Acidobacteriaceae bacterium]
MRVLVTLFVVSLSARAAAPTIDIKVDQAGYLPGFAKLAMVGWQDRAKPAAQNFTVRRADDNSVVLRGNLQPPVTDPDSGDSVQIADFSALRQNGMFYLEVPGVGRSWNFSIAPDVFRRAYYLAMRSFYGQRCGVAVDLSPEFPQYKHAACHLDGADHESAGKQGPHASAKGWHDAGDYGRYVVNGGISTGTILWTWELFQDRIRNIGLHIPES